MDSEMFMQWVEHRLYPTFEALYGPGTDLGGPTGKKMICIMVCLTISKNHKFIDNSQLHPSPITAPRSLLICCSPRA